MSTVTATRTVSSIIAGRPVADAPGGELRSTNPADVSDVVATAMLGDAGTLVEACRAARAAQEEWAATPAPVRGRAIQQIGRLVEENKDALARLVTREIGKPYPESLGEVQEIVDTCNFFLGEGRRLYGQTVPSEMPAKQLFTFRQPVGVAAIVTAGNFPVAVPSWYLVPALVCGNTVVWKPAEYAPALGDALTQLFLHGGLPEGVLNLVIAEGPATFDGLERALEERLVDKIGFTGSSDVGRQIGELAGRHLQSPCLELGGKNPMVVMEDADLDLAVEGALFSGFGTAGQRCTSLGTLIVHDAVHDEFLGRFAAAVKQAPIGDPTQDVLYGPMIHERFLERFEGWLDLIRDHHSVHGSTGTGRITSANPRDGFVGDPDAGLYCHPTVVSGVRADDDIANTETFGPLVGVARFSDFDEAMALANGHGYGLSSAIYTSNATHAFRFRERISAGMVSVNNSTSGAEAHLPFGGNGRSGNGARQSGIWVLDQFTRWQSMNWDYAGKLQKAQMETPDVEADLSFRLPDSSHQAEAETERLANLLSELLTLASERERPAAEDLSLAQVAQDARDRWEGPAEVSGHKLLLASGGDATVCASRGDLDVVLDNLIENALNYSPAGGSVTIEWSRSGRQAMVAIVDKGPGVTSEEREHVFERFFRGTASRGGAPGTGLGLAVVSALVQRWDGSVSVSAKEGGGTRAEVHFPAAGQDDQALPAPDPAGDD